MYAWDLNYMTKWKWIFSENECLNWNQCIRDYIELIATYTFVDLAGNGSQEHGCLSE
jgi:hypothetical protein